MQVLQKAEDLSFYECETAFGDQSRACLLKLRSQGDKVRASGAMADLRLLFGNVGQQICETAGSWGAAPGAKQVSSYVIDHAPCAVLILPDMPSEVRGSSSTASYELAIS